MNRKAVIKRVGNKDFIATSIIVVLLGIGAIVFAGVVRSRAPKDDGTYVPREVPITPEIELLQQYVRLETTAGHEMLGANFLRGLLAKNGIESELIEPEPGRGNLYARIRGSAPGGGLLLLHHIDVLPADASEWSEPPFSANIKDYTLYGRGTLDMKGIGICHLAAFLDVAKSGKVPKHDLVFLAVADEEAGSRLGMEWLVNNRPELFDGIQFAINEGGITELVREKIGYFAVQNGEKSFVNFRIRAGKMEDAEAARADLSTEFDKPNPDRILPEVIEYFEAIAPGRLVNGDILADPGTAAASGRFGELDMNYRMLTQNNIHVGAVEETPDELVVSGTASLLPDEDPEHYVGALRARVESHHAELDVLSQTSDAPVTISGTSTAFFRAIVETVHADYGDDVVVGPYMFPRGGTDCRFLRPRAIDCYGVLPFRMDFFQSQTIHHIDERVRLAWFIDGVDFTRDLVNRYEFDR